MRPCAVFLTMIVTTGCAPTIMQMTLAPTDVNLAATMLGAGSSVVKGSALIRQRGGGVVTCAGNEVFLIPATPSVTAELRRVFGGEQGYLARGGDQVMGGGTLVVPPAPNRTAICNAQGFFSFNNVRSGKWYVLTSVVWTVGDQFQGGAMLGNAVVDDGREADVVLSP